MDVNPVPLDESAANAPDAGEDEIAPTPEDAVQAETAPEASPEAAPAPADVTEAAEEAAPADTPVDEPVAAQEDDTQAAAEETPAEATAETPPEDAPAEAAAPAAPPAEEAPASRLRRGQIVEGVVKVTSPTEILVQIDDDLEGVISSRELARMDQQSMEELELGASILVYVLNPANRAGQAVLSLSRALEERDWRRALEYHNSQDVFEAKVSGYNRGGLIVRFGRVRGFVPSSQVSDDRRTRAQGESPIDRWGAMIGEDINIKVIEVDRGRNRLILSERAAMKEVRDEKKAELLDQLEVGDIRKGRVVSLTDFGAFVDLGGADGLIHLTEMSWKHVTRAEQIVKIGQEVEVEVISLDRRRNRIGLSLKSLERDPWSRVVEEYRVGQLVQGRVTKLTKFGAFACLVDLPEVEGLIHISELAENRVAHPRDVVRENEVRTLRIIRIDRQQRRLGLSIKQVNAIDYLEIDLATFGASNEAPPVVDEIKAQPAETAPPAAEETLPVADDAEAVVEESVPAEPEPVAAAVAEEPESVVEPAAEETPPAAETASDAAEAAEESPAPDAPAGDAEAAADDPDAA